jgi:hypothetical protein
MSGNVNATLTANIAQFQAAMAQAAASSQAFAAQQAAAAAAAQNSFNTLASGVNAAVASLNSSFNQVQAQTRTLNTNFNNLGLSAHFLGRELHAVVDEALAGRWGQLQGTVANVLFTIGAINPLLTAQITAVAAIAGGVGYLAYQWYEVQRAIRQTTGEMTVAGTLTTESTNQIRTFGAQIASQFNLFGSTAQQVVQAAHSVSGAAAPWANEIARIGAAQARLLENDPVKTTQEIANQFNTGAAGALSFADKYHVLDAATREHVVELQKAHDEYAAIGVVIKAVEDRVIAQSQALVANDRARRASLLSGMQATDELGLAARGPEDLGPERLTQPPNPQQPINIQENQDREAVIATNEALRQRTILQLQLDAQQRELDRDRAAAASGDAGAQTRINADNEAIITTQQRLTEVHTESERQQHEATVQRLQQDLIAHKDFADQQVPILAAIAAEQQRYHGEETTAARTASDQVTEGQRRATEQQLQLALSRKDGEIAAAKDSLGAQLALEQQKLSILGAYHKQGTLEYQTEQNRIVGLSRQVSDENISIAVSELKSKQDLAGQDFATKLRIEDQILAMLRAHYGEHNRIYMEEAQRKAQLENEAAQARTEIELRSIRSDETNYTRRLTALEQSNKAQLASYQLYFDQANTSERAFVEENTRLMTQRLDAELAKLTQGTTAYQQTMDLRVSITERGNAEIARLDEQAAQRQHQIAQVQQQFWESTFDRIGSEWARTTADLITYSTTWLQAEQAIAKSIGTAILEAASHVLLTWIATELAKTAATTTQNAVREAQEIKGQTGMTALILGALGIHIGAESAKTTATVVNNNARTASTLTSEAVQDSTFLVRVGRWIASLFGFGAASTATDTARTASSVAADATASGSGITANLLLAQSYAAVGAVAAGASVAAIPVTGWAAVPEVTAATLAELSGVAKLAALDVGAWSVPQDMVAQIHQGEMVIPTTFAQGMRDGGGPGGGGFGSGTGGGGGDGSGGTSVSLSVSLQAIDTQSGMAFLKKNVPQLTSMISQQLNRAPTRRPTY